MSIPPIPPPGVTPPNPSGDVAGAQGADVAGAQGADGPVEGGFGDALADGLQQVSDLEHVADERMTDMATGGPTSIQDVMVATSESQLAVDMLGQVRDKAIQSYQEIMRLQL